MQQYVQYNVRSSVQFLSNFYQEPFPTLKYYSDAVMLFWEKNENEWERVMMING